MENNLQSSSEWSRYLKFAILAASIFAIAFLGYQYYRDRSKNQAAAASLIYESMLTSIQAKDVNKAKEDAKQIIESYQKTPYATLSALMLARLAIDEKNLDSAIDYLRQAMRLSENSKGPEQHVARTRLAKVLSSKGKFDEALAVLDAAKSKEGYITLYEELKGDIYLMQNEPEKAKMAYKAAIKAAPKGVPITRLELKQNDLGN